MKSVLLALACCVSVQGTSLARQETNHLPNGEGKPSPLTDEAAAIAFARRTIGLNDSAANKIAASRTKIENDATPFLHQQINGRDAWMVLVQGPFSSLAPEIDHLNLLLDAGDGCIVRVWSDWPADVPPIPAEAVGDRAAEQMRNSGMEVYHDLVPGSPNTSLQAAFAAVAHGGVIAAKQVVCQHVLWSRMGKPPKPVWAIMLRGVYAFHPHGGEPNEPIFSHRYIVDTETGRLLCSMNTPRPEGPPPILDGPATRRPE